MCCVSQLRLDERSRAGLSWAEQPPLLPPLSLCLRSPAASCRVCTHSTCSSLKLCGPIGPCRSDTQTGRHEAERRRADRGVSGCSQPASPAHSSACCLSSQQPTHARAISWQHSCSHSQLVAHRRRSEWRRDSSGSGRDRARPPCLPLSAAQLCACAIHPSHLRLAVHRPSVDARARQLATLLLALHDDGRRGRGKEKKRKGEGQWANE